MFVPGFSPGSEKDETEREVFWNYLDGCSESFVATMSTYCVIRILKCSSWK